MFMQSFENSTKQQKRRSERQAAMQRMNDAAQMEGISMTSMTSITEDEETKQDPSAANAKKGEVGRVSQLLMDIVANPASTDSGDVVLSTRLQRGYDTQNSAGVAPNGSRFSVMEKTAQEFMWDDGSIASGASRLSGKHQVNLHDIKKSLQTQPGGTWSKHKSARWNAINHNAPVSEGLWSSLPLFGRGQALPDGDAISVKSSTSSKYRDEEGERLLGMAAQRLSKNEPVSVHTSIEEKEYGENCSDEEDGDIEIRRRVVLDREGNLTYEDDDYGDLHTRRMNNQCRRSLKRSATCTLVILLCVGIMVTFGVLVTQRLTGSNDAQHVQAGKNQGTHLEGGTGNDNEWYQQESKETSIETTHSDRFEAIKANLLKMRVTHPSAFDDIHSAQYAALKWLADDDPRQIHPWSEFIAQRYGLVTHYFSTTETEYEWHIPAEYSQNKGDNRRQRRLADKNGTSVWTNHDSWLTEKGVCDWKGITCNTDNVGSNEKSDGDVSRIDLKNNNMHGLICNEIYTTLPHLTYADFSNNGFTGILSSEIGLLSRLEHLNLTANRIGGSIPREIGEISQLTVMHFADNLLGNTIPHTIGDLSKLRDLDLSGNELKGTIPYELGNLDQLVSLDLASNQLKGDIPHEFSRLSLVTFDVGGNQLGGPLVTEIGLMSHLEVLRVNDNHLTGEIPSALGKLKHLNELQMSSNSFTGGIPSELSELAALDSLILANNELEGEFPVELTKLSGLEQLDLSNNQLKGEVPILIYDMKHLKVLNLAKNSFTGTLPTVLGSLFKLEAIELQTNQFVGTIPELGELTKLKKLILHNNMLTGTVSSGLCRLVNGMYLSSISADCAGEAALVVCECCQCHAHENIVHAG